MAITSIFMLITTLQTRDIQKKSIEISDKLSDLQDKANNQDLIKLQSEFRPYLIPKLIPNPPHYTVDGQSKRIFTLHEDKFLLARFSLDNVGKLPALNVRAKYDSPTQKDEYFPMGDNVIFPESDMGRLPTPWINIESIVKEEKSEPFDAILTFEYDGNGDIDNRRYVTVLKLTIQREETGKYKILDQDFKFQFQK